MMLHDDTRRTGRASLLIRRLQVRVLPGRPYHPTLGHLPLRRLDTATLDRFYSELRGRGGVGGRPMAPATVRHVHAILRRALDQAARWGWIPANPAALASPPRLGSAEIRPPPQRRSPGSL